MTAREAAGISDRPEAVALRRKLDACRFVLREREAELLELKGPCRRPQCTLHFAHRGPCLGEPTKDSR